MNIPLDQILVFGDGENDLTMFDAVKYPIAMGNAMDNVKKAAYEVIKTNNEDGIACFLKKYNIV
ncbi:HAD family hydrolase [Tannockella kyphosi]|uniref:HAD family hydrolase n=1 Tax=Tannockella kyphosi TaxID=2899121 RepID=UPI00201311A8|nr:HAD hydrolase family protein [Tannockella kyphosi]